MSRERWGTFSVKDHTRKHPFVAEVLMFNRLVIPKPADSKEQSRWLSRGWAPDQLDSILEVLGTYSEANPQGRALTVSWNEFTQDLFKRRAETAKIVHQDANFHLTRSLLAQELRPDPPPGVVPVAVLAAYPSVAAAEKEWIPYQDQERRAILTMALAHQFVVPNPKGKTDLELLQEAVGLAKDSKFEQTRTKIYDWQDDIIKNGITDKDALIEMSDYVNDYNTATKNAVRNVYTKLAFTLIPVAITAFAPDVTIPALASTTANLIRFWIFDRKPVIEAGESEPAAMFHTIYHRLGWRRASLSA